MKLRVANNLKKDGSIIFNDDDSILQKALSKINKKTKAFSTNRKDLLFYLDNEKIVGPSKKTLLDINDLGVQGKHNIANLFAAATCSHLIGINEKHISNVMKISKV